jgi:hypothetical protein
MTQGGAEMAKLQSIGFDDELHERISAYAEKKHMSFSRATVELAKAGMDFFDKSGTLDAISSHPELAELMGKLKRTEDLLKASEEEKIRLWDILKFAFTSVNSKAFAKIFWSVPTPWNFKRRVEAETLQEDALAKSLGKILDKKRMKKKETKTPRGDTKDYGE